MAVGKSLNFASCRGGWGERSCPRNVTTVAVDRRANLPIERRTIHQWVIAALLLFLILMGLPC